MNHGKSRKESGLGTELGGWFFCMWPVSVLLINTYHHREQLSVDSPHMFELRVIFLLAGFMGTFQAADFWVHSSLLFMSLRFK